MSPNIASALNAGVALIGVLAAMKPEMFPGYVPGNVSVSIIQTAGWLSVVWGGVNGVLHITSPSTPGALGK